MPRHDDAFDRKRSAKELAGRRDVTADDRLANDRAADSFASDLERRHHRGGDALFKPIARSLAAFSHGEVVSNDDLVSAELVDEQVLEK